MKIHFQNQSYSILRVPPSGDQSLRAVSAADEHILRFLEESGDPEPEPLVVHDRFGALTVPLHSWNPHVLIINRTQQDSILANLENADAALEETRFEDPLQSLIGSVSRVSETGSEATVHGGGADLALMRIPKSLELLEFYLKVLRRRLSPGGRVVAAFMTRHFTPALPEAASRYFRTVEQSRAWKKSRLLLMSEALDEDCDGIGAPSGQAVSQAAEAFEAGKAAGGTGSADNHGLLSRVELSDGRVLQQYPGGFSSGRVDPATAFLLSAMDKVLPQDDGISDGTVGDKRERRRILDLGCGSGVLALDMHNRYPDAEIHACDDSRLAVESARLNLKGPEYRFLWSGNLDSLGDQSFDLVISNPPFHVEYEIDISLPLRLFRDARRILRPGGYLILVGNRHLNYRTRLKELFPRVDVTDRTEKYEIIRCRRS